MAISPRLCLQPILDPNGLPISGALVYVYAAGTTTPLSLFSDSGLSSAAANPIVATAGFVPLRFMATASYKLVVTTSAGASVTGYDGDNIDPGVAIGSGALPVANGGTAATTAAGARTNLAAAAASDVATTQSDISNLQTWSGYTLTTRSRVASGTTAQQPTVGTPGLRVDTDTDALMVDNGTSWLSVKTSDDATATADVTAETAEDTYLRPDRLKYSQRTAIAWGKITFSGGTPSLANGFGVSGTITDNGAGDVTIDFLATQPNANYAVVAQGMSLSSTIVAVRIVSVSTTQMRFGLEGFNAGSFTANDYTFSFVVFGDFA